MKQNTRRRRAFVLVMVLAMVFVMAMLIAAVTTQVMHTHRAMRSNWQQQQAWWIAQSELDRQQAIAGEAGSRQVEVDGRAYRIDTVVAAEEGGITIVSVTVLDAGLAEPRALVRRTVYFIPPDVFLPILGWWEVAIGVGLLYRPLYRAAILLLFLQMPGTLLPLVLLPEVCFTQVPWGLTLEGQYIIKNAVLIGAALVVGGTVRKRTASERHSEQTDPAAD